MKAAIVKAPKSSPVYGDFDEPVARDGQAIVHVKASALTQLTKSRASGSHYSSDSEFPAIAGTDGVGLTADGRRVYFARPESPFGALAERALVKTKYLIPVPDQLDDITAAAIANPGMSAWAALMERAHFKAGETVLVNGATGTAGRVAVQLAKYLGAAKVIATGRNVAELEQVKALGADVVVHAGGASGEESIDLPGAGLRSSSIVLMGSGYKSVPLPALFAAVKSTFDATIPAKLQIAAKAVSLAEVEQYWNAPGKPRVVFTIG